MQLSSSSPWVHAGRSHCQHHRKLYSRSHLDGGDRITSLLLGDALGPGLTVTRNRKLSQITTGRLRPGIRPCVSLSCRSVTASWCSPVSVAAGHSWSHARQITSFPWHDQRYPDRDRYATMLLLVWNPRTEFLGGTETRSIERDCDIAEPMNISSENSKNGFEIAEPTRVPRYQYENTLGS
jgi:hypothetical protein